MEGLAAVVGQKGVAAKDDREQLENVAAPRVVFGEDVRPLVEEVALAAWQAQDLAEVDFQEILADRQRAPENTGANAGRWSGCPSATRRLLRRQRGAGKRSICVEGTPSSSRCPASARSRGRAQRFASTT